MNGLEKVLVSEINKENQYILYVDNSHDSKIIEIAMKELGMQFDVIPRYSAHKLPIVTGAKPGRIFWQGYEDIRAYFITQLYSRKFVRKLERRL